MSNTLGDNKRLDKYGNIKLKIYVTETTIIAVKLPGFSFMVSLKPFDMHITTNKTNNNPRIGDMYPYNILMK